MLNWQSFYRLFGHNSKGFSIIEVLVALALLGIIAVAFLGGLATASKAMIIADERATAESLARSQMEDVKSQDYDKTNDPPVYQPLLDIPPGYYIEIRAVRLDPEGDGTWNDELGIPDDDGIQEIIVTVKHGTEAETAKEVLTLEDYKVDR